jgi:hypothetical protein
VLPDSARGLDHSVEIVIGAGDARSEPVRISVVDSPSLLVREVRYDFPAYTRKQGEVVEWQGDIRALEGTQVTIVAESNQPLEDAWLDFDSDGDHDLKFTKKANDLSRVTRSFSLQMNADRSGPEHAIYRLLFRPRAASTAGREAEVVEPMEHRIEVIADLAPEVSIEEPRESPARVPPAAAVAIRVRALDPDFALARVGIETRLQGGPLQPEITLLAEERAGVFKGALRLVPERLGAEAGSVLEYRAVAVDTRPKTPNVSYSPWQSLQIDASAPPRVPEEPAPQSGGQQSEQAGEQAGERQEEQRKGDPGSEGVAGNDDQQARKKEDAAADPADRQQQPLENQQPPDQQQSQGKPQQQGQEKQQPKKQDQQNGPQGAPKQGDQSGAAEGSQQGGKQETPGQSQRGGKQGAGENQGQGADQGQGAGAQGDRSGGRQSGKQQSEKGEGEKAGDQNGGGKEAGGKEAGGKQGAANKPGAAGEGQSGGKKQPNPAVASDGTNDGEAMERILEHRRQEGGTEKSGTEKSGTEKSGTEKSGTEKSGSEKSGSEKSGSEKSGSEKSGSEKSGSEKQQQNQNQPPCTGSDGKPCGKKGCSNCSGGGKPGDAGSKQGGNEQSDGEEAGSETGDGDQSGAKPGNKGQNGEQARGVEEPGQPGQEKQGQGQGQGQGQPATEGGQSQAGEPGEEQRKEAASQDGQPGAQKAGKQPGAGGSSNAGSGDSEKGRGPEGKQGPAGEEPPQPAAGEPGNASSETGSGGWAGGNGPNQSGKPPADGPAPAKPTEWGEQDLANAKNAANLAVEHLRNAVESGRTDVLDQLGWTREQARAFLDRWEKMQSQADRGDPVQRGEFERAVRSLGLRPDGVRSSRDVPADVKGGQSEGRRSRPPSDYREQFKAYTQGTAGE